MMDKKMVNFIKEQYPPGTRIRLNSMKDPYRRIMEWSEMFDGSDMDVKKMIAGYIIKRVDVYSDYRLHIEFNMSFAQFELGLDTEVEYAAQDSVS